MVAIRVLVEDPRETRCELTDSLEDGRQIPVAGSERDRDQILKRRRRVAGQVVNPWPIARILPIEQRGDRQHADSRIAMDQQSLDLIRIGRVGPNLLLELAGTLACARQCPAMSRS